MQKMILGTSWLDTLVNTTSAYEEAEVVQDNSAKKQFFRSNLRHCYKFVIVVSLQRIVVNKMSDNTKTLKELQARLKTVVNLNALTPGKFDAEVEKSTTEYISGVVLSNSIMERQR